MKSEIEIKPIVIGETHFVTGDYILPISGGPINVVPVFDNSIVIDTSSGKRDFNAITEGWKSAIDSVLEILDKPETYGYVPDVGCHSCFDKIKEAVVSLRETPQFNL
jgi:hypothetical protein